ncbi:MAG TPA: SiaB family protein kinase [Bacteroidia bacterium]|nr:SiaB family protein kinase [Bacteroidia bacterium]
MSEYSHSEKEFVKEQYEQMLKEHQQNETVLVSHYGELSQSVISNLEGNVEEKITSLDIAKGPIKKIFFISVETLQNMLLHGQKNKQGEQHNFFILVKNGTNLKVISSNLVANSSIPALEKQINTINSFDDEKALKAYYLEHLENNTISDKGGAGLGFITIGMKSGNKLKVDFKKINEDFSLFTLTSSVNLS